MTKRLASPVRNSLWGTPPKRCSPRRGGFTQVSDAGLAHLIGLTNLRSLDLNRTEVTRVIDLAFAAKFMSNWH